MKTNPCAEVLCKLSGKRLATAESLTGGLIGAGITGVPGASKVYAGGIVSYTNEVKHKLLGVSWEDLNTYGAVSAPVAKAMAKGARNALDAEVAVSVTGLAGPEADEFGHPVGTVFVGYADEQRNLAREYHFEGDREQVRRQTLQAAMELILELN